MPEEVESRYQPLQQPEGKEGRDLHSNRAGEEKRANISFSIWPPTQRTRDAVTKRMAETLSSPSNLSTSYGTMSAEEAAAAAHLIEEAAFVAASRSSNKSIDEDDAGLEIIQIYSKEISKSMLDAVKSRASPRSPSDIPQITSPITFSSEESSS